MCVICIKRAGVKLPSSSVLKAMWRTNPDGGGFMYSRDGKVMIEKGFTSLEWMMARVHDLGLGADDNIVFHFRIATQAVWTKMTQPFAVTRRIGRHLESKDCADIGVAHNGIIYATSDGDKIFSDTSKFVADYVTSVIGNENDLDDDSKMGWIARNAGYPNKFAFLTGSGKIRTIGRFDNVEELEVSNVRWINNYKSGCKRLNLQTIM